MDGNRPSIFVIGVVLTMGTLLSVVFWRIALPVELVIIVVLLARHAGRRGRERAEPRE